MIAADGNSLIVPSPVAISRWTLLIAAAALVAACGETASSTPAPAAKKAAQTTTKTPEKKPASDTDQLDALLQKRASALEFGDTDGFVRTATGSQAAKDKRAI